MKAIAVEELETISPAIYAEAVKAGCTHVRISEPLWPGPAMHGPAGGEIRMIEFSWFKAILLKDAVIFDETEPERFLAVLEEYGLSDVKSMQPMRRHGREAEGEPPRAGKASEPIAIVPAPDPAPARQAITVHVLEGTKARMEHQANQLGLSLGGLLDRVFKGDL